MKRTGRTGLPCDSRIQMNSWRGLRSRLAPMGGKKGTGEGAVAPSVPFNFSTLVPPEEILIPEDD